MTLAKRNRRIVLKSFKAKEVLEEHLQLVTTNPQTVTKAFHSRIHFQAIQHVLWLAHLQCLRSQWCACGCRICTTMSERLPNAATCDWPSYILYIRACPYSITPRERTLTFNGLKRRCFKPPQRKEGNMGTPGPGNNYLPASLPSTHS